MAGDKTSRSRIGLFYLMACLGLALSACQEVRESPRNYSMLAADVHASVAGYPMVVPVIALNGYPSRQSFPFSSGRGATNRADPIAELVHDAGSPAKTTAFDRLSIAIRTYGWNDGDMQQRKICPMLTRAWARSICDNPWAAVQQSLPGSFQLVDLSRVRLEAPEPRVPRCARSGSPRRAFPTRQGEPALLCEEEVYGSGPGEFYVAVVKIDGHLGAVWSVWNGGQSGENAQEMAERQGRAIVAFVRYGIGTHEDFPTLYASLCALRAPNSPPGVRHLECGDAAHR